MKIGYVIKSYPRLSQTFIVNEILAHEAAGIEIEIFSLRPPREEERHTSVGRVKARVTYLPGVDASADSFWNEAVETARHVPEIWTRLSRCATESAGDVHQALVLARRVREHGITHLHAHFGNVATSVARLAGFFADVRYSFTAHARDIFHEKVVPAQLARKLGDAKAVVTVSDFNLRYLKRNYGAVAQGVRRIYNGLDMSRFHYADATGREPLIISVGRLVEKKGFSELIAACRLLKDRDCGFRCLIVGSGPLEEALRAQIARLDLANEVQLTGARPQDEVVRLVQEAAVFAAPCIVGSDGDRDGMPTVLLEAMALGTPCVATDVTGIPEILHDDDTGLMVPQHDVSALADAMERLLADAALRSRLAERARGLVEEQFDIHRNTARMREIFATPA